MANTLPVLTPEERHDVMEGIDDRPNLRKALAAQHPVHEQFAMAYENLGGVVGLTDWAQKNQTDFYKMVHATAPKPIAVKHSGGMKIELALARSPLDE